MQIVITPQNILTEVPEGKNVVTPSGKKYFASKFQCAGAYV
jgi:hypothetical protein